jgi:hypothetical protein
VAAITVEIRDGSVLIHSRRSYSATSPDSNDLSINHTLSKGLPFYLGQGQARDRAVSYALIVRWATRLGERKSMVHSLPARDQ